MSVAQSSKVRLSRPAASDPGARIGGHRSGSAVLCPGPGAGGAASGQMTKGVRRRSDKDQARDAQRLATRIERRGDRFEDQGRYKLRDWLTAALGMDPGNFTAEEARRVEVLAGSHASGAVCATGRYTSEEHRGLTMSEWCDEEGTEQATLTATWVQQVEVVISKTEFEGLGPSLVTE